MLITNTEILKISIVGLGFCRMAARARAQVAVNLKDLEAKSPEEKRLLALSRLGEHYCTV